MKHLANKWKHRIDSKTMSMQNVLRWVLTSYKKQGSPADRDLPPGVRTRRWGRDHGAISGGPYLGPRQTCRHVDVALGLKTNRVRIGVDIFGKRWWDTMYNDTLICKLKIMCVTHLWLLQGRWIVSSNIPCLVQKNRTPKHTKNHIL